ncbi:substrate-binding domain-containing protein [Luteolibacter sp. LG18]|uniref:substrate-binding domain-containing protein n=1 Tax=Luteolibacter sp. LG18 TaxID=2819286 RepID=UPI002B2D2719|nr:hypothetical protein llg_26400 [Luteolibacter sp. LG18]
MNPLERKNLSVRLADEIERAIRGGEWTGHLPGHRTLMQTYSVSATTCIAAIGHLETRGVISAGEPGKRRTILAKPRSASRALETLLMLHDMNAPSGGHSIAIRAYSAVWEEGGGRVVSQRVDFPRYQRPGRLMKEIVERHRADAIILQVATLPWIKAAMALCPAFLDGGEVSKINAAGVSYSMGSEIKRMAAMLYSLGHRRIAAPMELLPKSFEVSVRTRMSEVLGGSPGSAHIAALCPVFPEIVPAAWHGYWRKLFATVKPTAVIVSKDLYAHSLFGFCSRHGIAIPRDLSVVCLESPPSLEWCDPVPTRMRFPIKVAEGIFRKWLRGGCRQMPHTVVPLEYVPGETVAPPRG